MNLEKLKDQLIISEGVVYKTYADILGLKTCGIGHLCREGEPEYELPLGVEVSEDRVTELFEQDVLTAINDCKKIYDDWDKLPETDGEWIKASQEMLDSKWARQLPRRSKHLAEMMANVGTDS
jgi:GH24 family phage-related lysozyme (muramidase)